MTENNKEWLVRLATDIDGRLGHVKHALFDFDGTISVMREGWEGVMLPVMLDSIGSGQPLSADIEKEVKEYIDRSTGILTIKQMEWLADAVRRFGIAAEVLTPQQYKALYLNRLMVRVSERIDRVKSGKTQPADMMLSGAANFVRELAKNGITLYLASGTDHQDVVNEATVVGVKRYFNGGVYGALDQSEANGKERVIQRILDEHHLSGSELLVVGDGPVELREAKSRGAIALGVASDEITRSGWNQHKIKRLTDAGADLMVADFAHYQDLSQLLCHCRE